MDPNATLERIHGGTNDTRYDAIQDLLGWLNMDGFLPTNAKLLEAMRLPADREGMMNALRSALRTAHAIRIYGQVIDLRSQDGAR